MNTPRRSHLALALLTLVAAVATPVAAQDPAANEQEAPLDSARIARFARAHMAINDARDEFHGKVGRIHEEQGRERAREEMEAEVADILEANEMTREEYDRIMVVISLDGEARALFDQIMQALAEEGGEAR